MMNIIKKIWNFISDTFNPQTTEMYKRMSNLFRYIEYAPIDKLEKISLSPLTTNYIAEEVTVMFQSNLGTVKLELSRQFNNVFFMSYANYAGSTVFELKCSRYWVEVVPMLGDTLKAKDIDLAIYELEQYLLNNFGSADTLETKYNNVLAEKKRRHQEELKLLER